jgi:outer membrane protein TolC
MLRVSLALSAALAVSAALAEATLTLEQARKLALERQPSQAAWLRREVAGAWLSAWDAARAQALVRSLQAEQRRGIEAAAAALAAGRGTLAEVYAARQLLSESEDRLLALAVQAERAGETLGRWTGAADVTPAAAAPQWRNPPPLAQLQAKLEGAALREARNAYSEWRRSGERLANYDARILPDAQARVDALGGAYAAGRSDLGPLLEARRALIESRIRRLEIEVVRARARAALEFYEQKD